MTEFIVFYEVDKEFTFLGFYEGERGLDACKYAMEYLSKEQVKHLADSDKIQAVPVENGCGFKIEAIINIKEK
jgi:hypothetical protein